MQIDINPLYQCNNNCNYCYLGNLRKIDKRLQINELIECLDDILNYLDRFNKKENLYFSFYGGDLNLIDINTLYEYIQVLIQYGDVNIVLNITKKEDIDNFLRIKMLSQYDPVKNKKNHKVTLSVSLNKERQKNLDCEKILTQYSDKIIEGIDILQVVTPRTLFELKKKGVKKFLESFNNFNTNKLNFLEYSPSIYNPKFKLMYMDYTNFLKEVILFIKRNPECIKFKLQNIEDIESCLYKSRSVIKDDTIFITLFGKFKKIKYQLNNDNCINEYFSVFDSFEEVNNFIASENYEMINNPYDSCKLCNYKNYCYAEHYIPNRVMKNYQNLLNDDCYGHKELLDWYSNNFLI